MNTTLSKKIAIIVPLAAMFITASIINAATWTGAGDGYTWNIAENWDPAAVPDSSAEVIINGDSVVGVPSGNFERNGNTILSDNAQLSVVNGRFLQGQSACTFTISDNAVLNSKGDYFIVARNAVCEFNQVGGTLNLNLNRGFFMTDSNGADGSSYNLSSGILNVNFIYTQNDWNADFPGHNGHSGNFNITGGIANFTNNSTRTDFDRDVWVRYDSVVTVDGGVMSFEDFASFVIGRDGYGEAMVVVNNGTLNIAPTSDVIVGGANGLNGEEYRTNTGRLVINGGNLNITSGTGLIIGGEDNSAGGFVDQNGGEVFVNGSIILGDSATAVDSCYAMNGGSLIASEIVLSENADPSVKFYFNIGQITLAGDQTALANASWFVAQEGTAFSYDESTDTTTIARIPYAHNPIPANGSTNYGTPVDGGLEVSLSWNTGMAADAAHAGQPNPDIVSHKLYLRAENDPNQVFTITADGSSSVQYGPFTLDYDKTYYWHVDEITNEPNTIIGDTWKFSTPAAVPVITSISPLEAMFAEGDSVTLTAQYSTVSDVSAVKWFFEDTLIDSSDTNIDISFDNNTSTLTITNFSNNYIGSYYCIATNTGGDSAPSETAVIEMKKLIAWYEFNDNLTDSVGDFDGSTDAAVEYVTDGYSGSALSLTAADQAVVSIPRSIQDSFSIAFWVKTESNSITSYWYSGIGLVDGEMSGNTNDFGTAICGGKFTFGVGNSDTHLLSTSNINDNSWHYCVATRDADTGEMTVYVDGEMEGTTSGPAGEKAAPPTLVLGKIRSNDSDLFLDGLLDEVKLYNYVLDEITIADNFYSITGITPCVTSRRPSAKYDLNNDCVVDILDFAIIAENWMNTGMYPSN